jgi:hypothetical protein
MEKLRAARDWSVRGVPELFQCNIAVGTHRSCVTCEESYTAAGGRKGCKYVISSWNLTIADISEHIRAHVLSSRLES